MDWTKIEPNSFFWNIDVYKKQKQVYILLLPKPNYNII